MEQPIELKLQSSDYTALRAEDLSPLPAEDLDAFCLAVNDAARQEQQHLLARFRDAGASGDEDENAEGENFRLFKKHGKVWYTQAYAGVLRLKGLEVRKQRYDVEIRLGSRFDKTDQNYFFVYAMEKVFLSSLKTASLPRFFEGDLVGKSERTWDYLLLLTFIRQLRTALKKGSYHQYQEFAYNDSKIKGRIDFARYIREDIPFNGKVAYVSREYTVQNDINILILQAYTAMEPRYRETLTRAMQNDDTIRRGIHTLREEVENWRDVPWERVLRRTGKPIVQSVYQGYEPLRRTCRTILRRMGANTQEENEQAVSGVLIYMPKLWELFLQVELFEGNVHAQTSRRILNGRRQIRPDFLVGAPGSYRAVLDAKYKNIWQQIAETDNPDQPRFPQHDPDKKGGNPWDDLTTRADVYQVLSYGYLIGADICGVVAPCSTRAWKKRPLMEYPVQADKAAKFYIVPVLIPQDAASYEEFSKAFQNELSGLRDAMGQW